MTQEDLRQAAIDLLIAVFKAKDVRPDYVVQAALAVVLSAIQPPAENHVV